MKLITILVFIMTFASCSKDVSNSTYNSSASSQGELHKKQKTSGEEGEAQFDIQNKEEDLSFILPHGNMPEASSYDYLSILESQVDNDGKKEVAIKGIKIVLDKNSKLNIYNSSNISLLKLEASEIIVSEEFKVPGANLQIKAAKLIFIGEGKFNTTPNDNSVIPSQTVDGKKGSSGGDIFLDVESIHLGNSIHRFILNGGKGQAAGYGIPGNPGKSVESPNGENLRICTTIIAECHDSEAGPQELSSNVICTGDKFPTNGENAIPAGSPGAGGDGGRLIISNSLNISENYFSANPGSIGHIAPEAIGGTGGSPRKYGTAFETKKKITGICSRKGGGKFGGNLKAFGLNQPVTGHTLNGKNAISPTLPKEKSNAGEIVSSLDEKEFSEKYLSLRLLFAKDLYRNYKIIEAEKEFSEILKLSKLISNDKKVGQVEKESMFLLAQLKNHKDIQGYSLNFSPNLSMSKLVTLYKSEIDRAFQTLKFTSYFKNKIKSSKLKSEKIKSQIDELNENISFVQEQNSQAHNNHISIEKILNETIELQKAFDLAMIDVVSQIEGEAKNNIHDQEKKKKLLGSVKLLANLAKVSPVGQPAAAAIGSTIDSFVDLSQKEGADLKDIVKTSYNSYQDLKKLDWEKSKEDWNNNYSSLYYDKFKAKNPSITNKKFEAYMKNLVNSTKPLYETTSKYLEDNFKKQVPLSAYDKEVERIKSIHPRFKELTTKLSELQGKKEKLNNELMQTVSIIRETESNIIKSILAISVTESKYLGFVSGLDFTIDDALSFYEKLAKDTLIKYKGYMIKSYSYRLLKSWNGSLDIENIENKLSRFALSDGDTIDFDILKETYNEDLKLVSKEVFNSLSSGSLKEYLAEESFVLNSGELKALVAGKSIVLDLSKRIESRNSEENRRLTSIEIEDVEIEALNDSSFDFIFQHSGKSVLSKNNKNYSFVHESQSINWISRFNGVNLEISPLLESKVEESLFSLFLADGRVSPDDLVEHVGLDSSVLLNLSRVDSISGLKNVRVKVNYSFNLK